MKRSIMTVMLLAQIATGSAAERIELKGVVRGNQEQPGVLFLVPWQNPPSPEIGTEAPPTHLDAWLRPVSRERFRRQIYFRNHLELGEPDTESTSKP